MRKIFTPYFTYSNLPARYKKTAIAFLAILFCLVLKSEVGWGQTVITFPPTTSPWVVPAGVSSIKVEAWGGGGAGGGSTGNAGGTNLGSSGGGGAYNTATWAVNAGDSYTITVGTGGTGSSAAAGGNGTVSTVAGPAGTLTANFGTGGKANGGSPIAAGGLGVFNGGNGVLGNTGTTGPGGGGGAGNNGSGAVGTLTGGGVGGLGNPNVAPYVGGKGGDTLKTNNNGKPGSSPGGGGGGSRVVLSGTARAGGNGGAGQVVITYYVKATITNLSPDNACSGATTVTITGTNFINPSTVTFNGVTATSTFVNSTTLTATVPAGATTGPVTVTTPGGTSNGLTFTIGTPPALTTVTGGGSFCGSTTITASNGNDGTMYFQGTTSNGTSTATPSNSQLITTIGTNTYYFRAQSAAGCWGPQGSAVVTINAIPAAPTGSSTQPFCAINNPTVANLAATGTGIQWYSAPTGGPALAGTTVLVTGTDYYASQTVGGCESLTRLDVTATITDPAAPTGSSTQPFCAIDNPTVANLAVTGASIKWYSTPTGGTALAGTTALVNGTDYYASQTVGGCESSTRLDVTAVVNDSPAPTGSVTQGFCAINNPTVADLLATGTAINWYTTATGGTALATSTSLSSGHYYASQTAGSCESSTRLDVTVTVTNPAAPTGASTQVFCDAANPTVGDLIATGNAIQWYASGSGGTALPLSTPLVDGTTYYASQTDAATSCESVARLAVNATVSTALTGLSYSSDLTSYCANALITPNVPTITGGTAVSYSVSPALPNGLSLNTTTGEITGTPVTPIAAADYTITATNGCNAVQATINIAILTGAPANLTYSSGTAVYCENVLITDNTPSNTGGTAVNYSISPALPAGLNFDPATGIISGTPTTATPAADYTVTALNGCGSTTTPVNIAVVSQVTSVSYTSSTVTYCTNNIIIPNTVASVTGGGTITYSISPALPAGLSLNTSTGAISGTPTAATAVATYTISASNGCSNTTTTVDITVITGVSGLNYTASTITYCTNIAITNNTPSLTGSGTITYSVSPALPAGLSLDVNTGIISGTPTTVTTSAPYTVTATNGCSSTTIALTIGVIANVSSLSYSVPTATYCTGILITPNTVASVTGGGTITYSISPALPAGLSLNTSTGAISGTPTTATTVATYTITASNGCSNTTTTVDITVITGVSALTYTTTSASYCVNNIITNNTPTVTGGGTITYSVSPALPSGLSLDVNTGIISGTPTAATASNTYTVTATNGCSSTTRPLTIVVIANITSLTYSAPTATYCTTVAITSNTPTVAGGGTITYSVSPALPGGLALSPTTGAITGTPTTATAAATYTVTATNGCSSAQATLNLTVVTRLSALTYTTTSASYCVNNVITPNTVSAITGGGTITYSVAPTLPAGLSINPANGTISGTPTAVTASASYTVTATNGCSSTTRALTIVVIANITSLTYSAPTATYCTTVAITSNTPTVTGGGTINYSVSPALPAGLNLNTFTGAITGTPTTAIAAATYTVTATNGCSNAQATLNLTVITRLSALTYTTTSASYCVNNVITPNTVSAITGGGTITYSVAPTLPAGLSINPANGTISGTPTAATPSNTYTVTATNGCSSTTRGLTIVVNTNITSLSYSAPTATYCTGALITPNTATATGGGTLTYSVSPALPGGLTLSTTTGAITGTPTTAIPAADYTVTATNGCSSAQATVNLTVMTGVSGLTYSPSAISTCINTPIATATPSVTGGGTITYSVSPALPAGISLNTATGVISGTPTVAASGTYTVTAGNGCSSTSVSIIITVSPIPVITSVTATPATICLGASSNLVVTAPAGAATTIVNYDFNSSSGTFGSLSPVLASGITSTASGTAAFGTAAGIATTGTAFTTNGTAGQALSSAQANSWTFTLGGASLSNYKTFKIYAQAVRGGGGSNTITLSYALNGSTTFITAGITSGIWTLATSGTWVANIASLPVGADFPTTSIAFRLTIGGGAGTPEQLDNFQVQAVPQDAYSWIASPAGASAGLPGTAGTSLATNNNISVSPTVATTYTVTATNAGGCQQTGTPVTVTVNPTPGATISGDATVCQGSAPAPVITFTNPMSLDVTATYNINGTGTTTINIPANGTNTVNAPTGTAGTFVYNLVSVAYQSTPACSTPLTGQTATVIVRATPAPTISGTTTVCQNGTSPNVTFSNPQSLPVTITYDINGGTPLTIDVAANATASVAAPTGTAGTFIYTIESVVYQSGASCPASISGQSVTVTVNPTPTATISGDATVCQASTPAPVITFTNPMALPVTITYNINGTGTTTINVPANGTNTVTASTAVAGPFAYNLVSVSYQTAPNCPNTISGTATVTVNPLPTATISGTTIVCHNSVQPNVTFTGSNGTAPYTFTYTINAGAPQTVTTVSGNSVDVPVPTTTTGVYTYTLVSVQDASSTTCSNTISGQVATVTVKESVVITTQPVSQTTCATFPVSYMVTATGDSLYYQWYKDGVALSDNSNISGSQTAQLNIDEAGTGDIGTYYVIVSGSSSCGPIQSDDATLAVIHNTSIVITTQPDPQAVCTGGTATFTVVATGTGISYQWLKGTLPLSDGVQPGGSIISGSATATLTITGVSASDAATNYNVEMATPGGSGCPQQNSAKVALIVNPIPTVNSVANKVLCNNTATGVIPFSGSAAGTVYNWTNDNTTIGLAASGSGNILSFTATNTGTAPVTATIQVTPTYTNAGTPSTTCTGSPITFTITVNPTPVVTPTPASQQICSGSATSIALTSNVPGATFNWTVQSQTGASGATASNGSSIAQTLTATGTTDGTVTYSVTPTASTCPGTAVLVTITVHPTATVTATPVLQEICSGGTTSIALTSNVAGATFNWTVQSQTGASGATAGSGASIAQTLTATGGTDGTVTYLVTPSASTCPGTPKTVTITVHPAPTVIATPASQTLCSGDATSIALTSNVSGATFVWTVQTQTGASGASGGSGSSISQVLTATGTTNGTVTYLVTPTVGSCPGTATPVTITVQPRVIIAPLTQEICNGSAIATIDISPASTAGSISWTRDNPAGISSTVPMNGTGAVPVGTFTSTNPTATIVTFTINTTAANGCTSTVTATVTVDAALTALSISASQILCTNPITGTSSPAPLTSTAPTGGGGAYTYQWYTSASSTGPWAPIATATGPSYQPPTPTTANYYELILTNACGKDTSNVVEVAVGGSAGLSFSGSFTNPSPAYCSGSVFGYTETSISFFGLGGGADVKYVWQSQDAGYFTSTTTNPYGVDGGFPPFLTIYTGAANFTVHNSTNAPVTENLVITPIVLNSDNSVACTLNADIVPVTINPTPIISSTSTATCSGTTFTYAPVNGSPTGDVVPAGTKYSWSAPVVAGISGTAAGTNQASVSGTPINNTNAPIIVTYVVTPTYTSGITCPGTSTFNVTVTVNPTPKIPTASVTICTGTSPNYAPANAPTATIVPSGTTYTWTVVSSPVGITGASNQAGPQTSVNQVLTNSTASPLTVIYSVTPKAGSCPGTAFTLNVTVNPTLTAAVSATAATVCSGTGTTINFTGNPNAVVYYKVNGSPATITLNSAGTATLNTGNLTTNTTYSLDSVALPGSPSCSQPLTATVTVNVNAVATATISAGTSPICSGQSSSIIFNGTPNTIVTYNDGTANQTVTLSAGGTATVTVNPTITATYTLISVEYPGTPNCLVGLSGSATITVNPNANAGTVTGTSPLCINATATYTSNGDAGGSWSSDNLTVATVDAVTGLVTAKAGGTANIIYTVNSGCNSPITASHQLIVNPNANAGTINGPSAPVCAGGQVSFTSTGDAGGTWSTSDGTVASVSTTGVVSAISDGTAIITYTVNSGCNPPSSATKSITVVNAGALLDPDDPSGPTGTLCPNTQFVFTVTAVTGATYYVWTLPPGWTTSGSTTTPTNSITVTTNGGGTGTLSVVAGNACSVSPSSGNLVVTVGNVYTWLGFTPDWNTASNWCGGVPTALTDVLIPATGGPGYNLPVLSANGQAHDITISSGANINLNGFSLTVNGAFGGTGTVSGSATSGLTINGAAGTVYFNQASPYNQVKTLTVNTGGSLKLGDDGVGVHDTLNIAAGNSGTGYGTVVVTGGTLDANGVLTLKSDVNGTARVGQSTGTISGNVTVERYIPPIRAWRFMAFPFGSSGETVKAAWQEGANNLGLNYATDNINPHPGYGTHITGDNNTSLGYDYNTTVNPSYKVWDATANNWNATEPPTVSTNIASFNGAYCIFIRGSRAVDLSQATSASADPTVLRSTGVLNQTGPVAPMTYTGGAGNAVMIGNPYASTINFLDVINRSAGIDHDKFWVWDPKSAGTSNVGGYVSYANGILTPPTSPSFPGGINDAELLQSSQSFMVQLSAGSSSVTMDFREADKLAQAVNVFGKPAKPSDPVIYTNLMLGKDNNMMLVDGVAAGFNKRFKATVDGDDAAKLWNFDENIALVRDGKALAIEFRPPITKKDTLFYDLGLKQKSYTLKIFAANIGSGSPAQAWLIDKNLDKQTLINLNDTSYYSFTASKDTAKDRNRFILVFSLSKDTIPKPEKVVSTASVYPNPVSGNSFNLVLQDFDKGDYKVNVYNSNGSLIITRSVHNEGGKNTFNFKLPVNAIAGHYILKVVNSGGNVVSTIPVVMAK